MNKVNYTSEMIDVLRAEYKGEDNDAEISALSEKTGKTKASIRAKLASLGLYRKAEKSLEGERVTKTVIAEAIGEAVGLDEVEVEGLAKAGKSALDKILKHLA